MVTGGSTMMDATEKAYMHPTHETHDHKHEDEEVPMDIDHIKEWLQGHLRDEACGAMKYYKLCQAATIHGDHELAETLRQLAYEEFTHAYVIKEHLEHWDMLPSDEDMVKYYRIKEIFKM